MLRFGSWGVSFHGAPTRRNVRNRYFGIQLFPRAPVRARRDKWAAETATSRIRFFSMWPDCFVRNMRARRIVPLATLTWSHFMEVVCAR